MTIRTGYTIEDLGAEVAKAKIEIRKRLPEYDLIEFRPALFEASERGYIRLKIEFTVIREKDGHEFKDDWTVAL